MIEIRHLCKKYANVTPLEDVNTVINDGDVIAVIGPSGVGKSTLLRCMNRLEEATSGEVIVDGVNLMDPATDISAVRKKMGMVFQSFNLFGHLTVIENLMKPQIDLLGRSKQEAYDRALELLDTVGLSGREFNYPDMLSGGQKQRVAIARTLAMECDVILFDEPTSALDPPMIGEVQAVIRRLARTGKTMLIVTHEMKFAREVSNRVFYMDEGRIYEEGTPDEIFDHPKKEKTQRFIRQIQEMTLSVRSQKFDYPEAIAALVTFSDQNSIDVKTLRKLEIVFEELVCNLLLPMLGSEPRIDLCFQYSGRDNLVDILVSYSGEPFDLESTEDELALKLVQTMSSKIVKEGENRYLIEVV